MARRPSFQFYPADWRNDAALRMCSLAARGLWWEMLCVMHTSEPYGHLVAAGKAIEPEALARVVGESAKDVRKWIAELERNNIFSRTDDGVIFSRRMVRDEKERDNWRDRQAKSRESHGPPQKNVTRMSRRSSSSPSSSVSQETSSCDTKRAERATLVLPDWLPIEQWKAFGESRTRLKAPLTDGARKLAIRELTALRDAGEDPAAVLEQSVYRGWKGLFATKPNGTAPPQHGLPKAKIFTLAEIDEQKSDVSH